ncbi:hypothetical protein C0209_05500 [Moraxella catarrhalis]|nr:hypothetical protein [Moraxella catarrhalis]
MTDESKGRFALQEGIGYFIRRILYIGFNCSYHDAVTKPCFDQAYQLELVKFHTVYLSSFIIRE